MLKDKLLELGFTEDEDGRSAQQENADTQGMGANGTYAVQAVYVRGDVVITVEQNQAPEPLAGLNATITHPATAVLASPKGRVAFNPLDVELAEALVSDLG